MRFYCWLFKENPLILGKKKEAEYTAHERSIVDRQGQLYGWVGAVVAWAGAVLTLGGGNNDHNTLFQSILRHPKFHVTYLAWDRRTDGPRDTPS